MVRVTLQEFADALELIVREPERLVQGLFRNLRQKAILAPPPDGAEPAGGAPRSRRSGRVTGCYFASEKPAVSRLEDGSRGSAAAVGAVGSVRRP